MTRNEADFVVIGGGFYGCGLALFLRSTGARVILLERGDRLLDRASRVNQARIHTGFHYPRNVLTAVKSMVLHARFAADFPTAVRDDFQMLYAVARHRTKISARQFWRLFNAMGAPIEAARPQHTGLFDADRIDGVFACREFAFDHRDLARIMGERLHSGGVDVRLGTEAVAIEPGTGDALAVSVADGARIAASHVFNVTYSGLNQTLARGGLAPLPLKFELAELALIEAPDELAELGVTVMDGPFFSAMPYPARGLHSLSHVRYTPHAAWTGATGPADRAIDTSPQHSRFREMIADAARYLPSLAASRYRESLYEVKCLLQRSDIDDGRPILFHQGGQDGRLVSIMGGKIDNIYDLFSAVSRLVPGCAGAHTGLLVKSAAAA